MGELRAELARELNMDVAEMGDIKGRQSGGLVMLRCGAGLVGYGVKPGGLRALDSAFR